MFIYANHINGSLNKDTGETLIRFFQITPGISSKDDMPIIEGLTSEMVSAIVMDKDTARDLLRVLKGFFPD